MSSRSGPPSRAPRSSFAPCGASVAAICQRRMRFVSAEPDPSVEREKLANHVSASARSERSRARSGSAVRIPLRRSALVGPCVSSRSANSAAEAPFGTTRCDSDDPAVPDERDLDRLGCRLRDRDARRQRRRRRATSTTARGRPRASPRTRARGRRAGSRIGLSWFAASHENACKRGADYRRARAYPHPPGAESRDARAPAPASAAPAVGDAGRRARRGAPGAVAALAVHRPVVAPRRVRAGTSSCRAVARRRVVKATLMRTTLHLVSAADYLAYAGIYRERRIGELQRQLAALGEEADFEADGERLAAFAAEAAADTTRAPRAARSAEAPHRGASAVARPGTGSPRTPVSSTARRRRPGARNTAGGTFVPARNLARRGRPASGAAAAAHLVRRYLAAFGPASRAGHRAVDGPPARGRSMRASSGYS